MNEPRIYTYICVCARETTFVRVLETMCLTVDTLVVYCLFEVLSLFHVSRADIIVAIFSIATRFTSKTTLLSIYSVNFHID